MSRRLLATSCFKNQNLATVATTHAGAQAPGCGAQTAVSWKAQHPPPTGGRAHSSAHNPSQPHLQDPAQPQELYEGPAPFTDPHNGPSHS